jgi:putative colanic acid biosynthesis acetyltransferase WcaF
MDDAPQSIPTKDRRALDRRPHPPFADKARRGLWQAVWLILYRPSPVPLHGWRRFLLRAFGARIAATARPYPSVRVWAPWNLTMAEASWLGAGVDCYAVAPVEIGARAVISQRAFLCTASHDYNRRSFDLVTAPIKIGADAWVAAEAYVGPGVVIGEGAVVAARAVATRDVDPWTVVAGNPARRVADRDRNSGDSFGPGRRG